MSIKLSKFRKGVLSLRTRRFGTVAELMIKKLYNICDSTNIAYDGYDTEHNLRVEIKFATVNKTCTDVITADNLIEQVLKASLEERLLTKSDIQKQHFDCNIQQIKPAEFDILYYGIFFADTIEVFKVNAQDIETCPGYSNLQHRNNIGEGQFHINNTTYAWHYQNHFLRNISYEDLFNLFKKKKGENKNAI